MLTVEEATERWQFSPNSDTDRALVVEVLVTIAAGHDDPQGLANAVLAGRPRDFEWLEDGAVGFPKTAIQ